MQPAKLDSNQSQSLQALAHLDKPVKDLTFVAFDTETTGRHPIISGLVEISAIKFRATGEIIDLKSQLINPRRPIPGEVTEIHGITDQMVSREPEFQDVIPGFLRFMRCQKGGFIDESNPSVFLAHNAVFDLAFLQVAITRLGLPLPANPVLDTLKLSRYFIRDSRNHRLKTLIEKLGQGDEAVYHRAEADSRHVMKLFLEILRRAGQSNTLRLRDLIDAGGVLFFSKPFEEIKDLHLSSNLKVRSIGEAIEKGRDLLIHYKGRGCKIRQITPLSVLFSAKRYYLSAYCHAVGNERTFRVDRITNMELVPGLRERN